VEDPPQGRLASDNVKAEESQGRTLSRDDGMAV
jgi:hypothetical protein